MKQSFNKMQVIGTVEELNFKLETKEVELKGANEITKKITCDVIEKKEFKNPNMTVKVCIEDEDGKIHEQTIGVEFNNGYGTNEKKLDENGNLEDNPRFKVMKTIMEYEKGTRVKIDGSLRANEYATEQGEWKSRTVFSAFNCSSTNVPEKDMADGKISGIIRTVKHETKGEDAEETGRLKVDFYMLDYNCATFPIQLTVEEDLADDFEDLYPAGTCCLLDVEFITKHIGQTKTSKKGAMGRRQTNMVTGFDVTEISVFGGDEPLEEENELFITVDEMKQALKERDMYIETKIKDKKEKSSKKEEKAPRGLGNRKSTAFIDNNMDSPF